jgi:antirestriction protein ArdC
MLNIFFAWDEAYTRAELAIFPEIERSRAYRGLNVFMQATQGYGSPYWLTFNQVKQLGAHVRQGEKSSR